MPSTGHRPNILIAIDKSTPHRDTYQAILLITSVYGNRMANPIDATIVYDTFEGGI